MKEVNYDEISLGNNVAEYTRYHSTPPVDFDPDFYRDLDNREYWFCEHLTEILIYRKDKNIRFCRASCWEAIRVYLFFKGFYKDAFDVDEYVDFSERSKLETIFFKHYKKDDKEALKESGRELPERIYFAILPELKKLYRTHLHTKHLKQLDLFLDSNFDN